jgi:hypothetical protein
MITYYPTKQPIKILLLCRQVGCVPCEISVLTAASMKMTVLWDMAPCTVVEVDRGFRGAYCLHHQGEDGGRFKKSRTYVTKCSIYSASGRYV